MDQALQVLMLIVIKLSLKVRELVSVSLMGWVVAVIILYTGKQSQVRQAEGRLRVVPIFLRDSRASETRARVKITPREKRRLAAGIQRKMRDYRQSPSF